MYLGPARRVVVLHVLVDDFGPVTRKGARSRRGFLGHSRCALRFGQVDAATGQADSCVVDRRKEGFLASIQEPVSTRSIVLACAGLPMRIGRRADC